MDSVFDKIKDYFNKYENEKGIIYPQINELLGILEDCENWENKGMCTKFIEDVKTNPKNTTLYIYNVLTADPPGINTTAAESCLKILTKGLKEFDTSPKASSGGYKKQHRKSIYKKSTRNNKRKSRKTKRRKTMKT